MTKRRKVGANKLADRTAPTVPPPAPATTSTRPSRSSAPSQSDIEQQEAATQLAALSLPTRQAPRRGRNSAATTPSPPTALPPPPSAQPQQEPSQPGRNASGQQPSQQPPSGAVQRPASSNGVPALPPQGAQPPLNFIKLQVQASRFTKPLLHLCLMPAVSYGP